MSPTSHRRFVAWSELQAWLTATHPDARVEADDACTVGTVRITPLETGGGTSIELVAQIGPARLATTSTALRRNLDLVIGAACVDDHSVFLRHTIPLDCVDDATLDDMIATLATSAVGLRRRLEGDEL
jgi:hypothetical protein